MLWRPCGTVGPMSATYPEAIVATTADLPPTVAAALDGADPAGGSRFTTTAAGIPFSALTWGDPADRPLVLIHGVTASARIWWRVGPALAATGRRVVAVDQAGPRPDRTLAGPPSNSATTPPTWRPGSGPPASTCPRPRSSVTAGAG